MNSLGFTCQIKQPVFWHQSKTRNISTSPLLPCARSRLLPGFPDVPASARAATWLIRGRKGLPSLVRHQALATAQAPSSRDKRYRESQLCAQPHSTNHTPQSEATKGVPVLATKHWPGSLPRLLLYSGGYFGDGEMPSPATPATHLGMGTVPWRG